MIPLLEKSYKSPKMLSVIGIADLNSKKHSPKDSLVKSYRELSSLVLIVKVKVCSK